jgi:glutaredoxin
MARQKKVRMYTLSTCGYCRATKKFLDSLNVKYDFTDVDLLEGEQRTNVMDEVRKINPRCSFPTILIEDRVIVGFREEELRDALGVE